MGRIAECFIIAATKKLAPIFMKKGKKEEVNSPVKKPLDPEAEKRRRAFLMSDVPEELRRQAASAASAAICDYPPFPVINHMQQVSENTALGGYYLWKLPEVSLKYRAGFGGDAGVKEFSKLWIGDLIHQFTFEEDCTYLKVYPTEIHLKSSTS